MERNFIECWENKSSLPYECIKRIYGKKSG
jgi:hypothetical protein